MNWKRGTRSFFIRLISIVCFLKFRVRLSRRRAKEGFPKVPNSRLLVTHREQNDQEEAAQNSRLGQLQTIQEEDETAAGAGGGEEEAEGEERQNDSAEKMDEHGEMKFLRSIGEADLTFF